MEITQEQLKEKIQNGDKVIVDFWAPWCGPCRMVKPLFEKVSNDVNTQMYTMNVDENREMAIELGIRSIPTIKAFSNGSEVNTHTGIITENQLISMAENLLNG
jgi:thioredoxin 1